MSREKLKPGSGYLTRSGRPVVIYAVDRGGVCPVHGAFLNHLDHWVISSWTHKGSFNADTYNDTNPLDIMPKARQFWAWENGAGMVYNSLYTNTSKPLDDKGRFVLLEEVLAE